MKLSQLEIEQVQAQTTVEPILDDHPAMPHLKTYIGDHSFYIGSEGIFIWEYAGDDGREDDRINALRVASWADPDKRTIAMHTPQLTKTVINLTADQVDEVNTPPPVSEALETEDPNAASESTEIASGETTEPATADSDTANFDLLARNRRIFESAGELGEVIKSKPVKSETAEPATGDALTKGPFSEDAHAEDGIPKGSLWEDALPKKKSVKDDSDPVA